MKSLRTEMLFHPSMEECVKAAVVLGMPEAEGRKFFFHYESNGWKVGKLPMKSFAGSMGGWHERWLERTGGNVTQVNGKHHPAPMSDAQMIFKQKEYDRIVERQRVIKASYDAHADCLRPADREEWGRLVTRKKQLKAELGIVI